MAVNLPIDVEDFDPDVVVTTGSTLENADHLPKSTLRGWVLTYGQTRIGRQELYAEILDDVAGALWTTELLERTRIKIPLEKSKIPAFTRVVVAIDPMVTAIAAEEGSKPPAAVTVGGSETGIIAAALGANGHAYVLDDQSLRASPLTWAQRALTTLEMWHGDRIIGEKNNGGALIETTLRSLNPNVPYTAVDATHGKYTRAEPVAAFYERNLVHHVGVFTKLEAQLVSFTGDPTKKSPDRLDALVWALTALLITNKTTVPLVGPSGTERTNYWDMNRDG